MQTTHLIERTSPIGGKFLGTCRYCGETNLTIADGAKLCPAAAKNGITPNQSIIDAIHPPQERSHDLR